MKKNASREGDELRPEYDMRALLARGVRGKYTEGYQAGTNLVLIEPDVHKAFPSDKDVNDALRLVMELRKIGRKKKAG